MPQSKAATRKRLSDLTGAAFQRHVPSSQSYGSEQVTSLTRSSPLDIGIGPHLSEKALEIVVFGRKNPFLGSGFSEVTRKLPRIDTLDAHHPRFFRGKTPKSRLLRQLLG